MKRIIVILLLSFSFKAVNAQWETVYFLNLPALMAVDFKDFNNGVAVGYSGAYDGIIIKTNDNGTTWDTVLSNMPCFFQDVVYPDFNTIIAVGYSGINYTGFIAKSIDNGIHWDTASYGQGVFSISFPSENIGYAAGNNGIIYKTTNKGNNWTTMSIGSPNTINSIHFINDTIGFACADSLILKTINGGISWSSINMHHKIDQVCFSSDSIGFFYADYGSQVKIYKTTNMGSTWSLQANVPSNNFMATMSFINDTIGFMGGFFQIQKTIDGGSTWTQQSCTPPSFPDFFDWVSDIDFLNQDTGFAAGYGIFYRTILGGVTTTSQYYSNLNISIFPNPSTGLINISFTETAKDSKVDILNSCGQVLLSKEVNNSSQSTFDLSNQAKGMYFIKVQSGNGVVVRKVVISE